jgi:hypothetical protein
MNSAMRRVSAIPRASECVDETMYAFATEGETKKRDLNAGDIQWIVKLYQ